MSYLSLSSYYSYVPLSLCYHMYLCHYAIICTSVIMLSYVPLSLCYHMYLCHYAIICTSVIMLSYVPLSLYYNMYLSLNYYMYLSLCYHYVSSLFSLLSNSHSLRSSPFIPLLLPYFNKKSHSFRLFSYAAPHLWKHLPNNIRTAPTYMSFRKNLKTCLFNQAFPI